jgi:hypothetical protein
MHIFMQIQINLDRSMNCIIIRAVYAIGTLLMWAGTLPGWMTEPEVPATGHGPGLRRMSVMVVPRAGVG